VKHSHSCIVQPAHPARNRALSLLVAFLALLASPLHADESGHPPGTRLLLLVGSNTLGETAIPELARSYLQQQKKVPSATIQRDGDTIYVVGTPPGGQPLYIEIHASGSGDCFKSFLGLFPDADAPCDIGMSSRPAKPEEIDAIKQKTGSDLTERGTAPGDGCEHPVGMDGVAIVVPSSNPISRIAFSELQAIYSRKITDWSQLADWKFSGGPPAGLPILPIRRKEPSGTLDFFKERIKPDPGPMADESLIPAYTSSGDLVQKVINTPGAIGFVGQSYALAPGLKRLQIYNDSPSMAMTADEAVFPDNDAVSSEYYPLSRVVYLYTTSFPANAEVQPFIQYALGDDGQAVLAGRGGLVKIAGTHYEIVPSGDDTIPAGADKSHLTIDGREEDIILRLNGSNTVGAQCAVNLAINYFMAKRQASNPKAPIEDKTTPLQTPEGESALAHDIMCDVDGDGTYQVIQVRPTGSSDAFRGLHQGLCDIGMASRPITEAEKNYLMPVTGNLALADSQYVLGLDALAVIVSKSNKVDHLTLDQLRRIYIGEITNWSAVGGADQPIHLHSRPDRSGTYKYFCDSVLLGRSVPDSTVRHPENSQVTAAVLNDPAAIGFVPMSTTGGAKVLKIGQDPASTFALPSDDTVQSGKYPPALCRYIYFYVPASEPHSLTVTSRENWERAREFADLSQDWRGQAIVAAGGFITETNNLDTAGKARRAPGENIQAFIQRIAQLEAKSPHTGLKPLLPAGVLCPRLLFDTNEWVLTPESKNVIDRKLASWLKIYPDAAKNGFIAEGWTDSVGSDDQCMALSLRRAQTVANYISDKLGVTVTPVAKGKSFDFPNTSELNKQQNRRVVLKIRQPA
jgi:phosphate transport system substrate-binding protein